MVNRCTNDQKFSNDTKQMSVVKSVNKTIISKPNKDDRISNKSTEARSRVSSEATTNPKQSSTVSWTKKRVYKTKSKKNMSKTIYFEEKLREKRLEEYNRERKEALKRRTLWKRFVRELERDARQYLLRCSAPEWWQEPSRSQINLATCLGGIIKADEEEGVTGRTRQCLLDLGVTTRLSSKQVRSCMKRSLLNPVDFLLEIHDLIVNIQKNEKKKKGHLEKPFTVDERIVLSAMCVLQLPTLLTMLHYILPPTKPLSESTYVQEMLYGDLDDEGIRYATPYMEPLPFRNQEDFKAWAFDRVYKALLPSVLESIPTDQINEDLAVRKISTSPMTPHTLGSIMPSIKQSKRKLSDQSSIPSVLWLMSQCVCNRNMSSSVISVVLQNSEDRSEPSRKSFSRKLSKRVKRTIRKQNIANGTNQEYTLERNDLQRTLCLENQTNGDEKELVSSNRPIRMSSDPEKSITYESINNEYEGNLNENKAQTEITKEGKQKDSFLQKLGLQSVWDEIEAIPQDKQLQHAISILAKLGDPLAQLPRVYKIPSVRRWAELRRGERRILTKAEKDVLFSTSKRMWRINVIGKFKEVPKVKCSKKKERLLTWDKKNWLTSEITKEVNGYFSRLRADKVDNARNFFPSMLNRYDYGSKLNRNIRDVYYTYLPAKEAELKVYRPW